MEKDLRLLVEKERLGIKVLWLKTSEAEVD